MVLAVEPTITKHSNWDALLSVLACKLAWLTVLHRHVHTTRWRRGHTAGDHQLIYLKQEKRVISLPQTDNNRVLTTSIFQVQFLASSAAEDLHSQIEGVSELHGDDAQVASFDQPTEPAGHRGSAHHAHLKHLRGHFHVRIFSCL